MNDFNWPLFLLVCGLAMPPVLMRLGLELYRWRKERRKAVKTPVPILCSWCQQKPPTCFTYLTRCCATCCRVHHGRHAGCRPLCQRCLSRPQGDPKRGFTLCDWCGI